MAKSELENIYVIPEIGDNKNYTWTLNFNTNASFSINKLSLHIKFNPCYIDSTENNENIGNV